MSEAAVAEAPLAGPKPVFSNGYKGLVLAFLLLAYTFNFIDRTIIATIGQAIKVDLKLDDAQVLGRLLVDGCRCRGDPGCRGHDP